MDYIGIFRELNRHPAVSGHESRLAGVVAELFEKYCDKVEIDSFYNVVGFKQGYGRRRRKILVTAHLDEIGLIVKGIDEKGFIKFTNIGGMDRKILPAQEVTVHGTRDVYGVIGAKPPHLLKPEEIKKAVKFEDMTIDTGLSAAKLKEYVSIGDIITIRSQPTAIQNNRISSKAMDNRCSIAAIMAALEELAKIMYNDDLYLAATVQEEFSLMGAITTSYRLEPDIAIVVDGTHGDIPDGPKEDTFYLGKGPAIGMGPNLDRQLTKRLFETARNNGIPYQTDVEPGDTGTEAWAIQVSRYGIPTVLVSIPLRYMHTPVEVINSEDIKNAGRLMASFIAGLEPVEEVGV